jgi:hypothetical protein
MLIMKSKGFCCFAQNCEGGVILTNGRNLKCCFKEATLGFPMPKTGKASQSRKFSYPCSINKPISNEKNIDPSFGLRFWPYRLSKVRRVHIQGFQLIWQN